MLNYLNEVNYIATALLRLILLRLPRSIIIQKQASKRMRGLGLALRGWQPWQLMTPLLLLLLLRAQDAQGALQYVYSSNGLLDTTLRIQQGVAYIDGRPVNNTITYNGLYPGPTLVVQRGDRVRILLHNDLVGMTINIHYHGLHVSPEVNAAHVGRWVGGLARSVMSMSPAAVSHSRIRPFIRLCAQGTADNVEIVIHPGQSFQYDFVIPMDHDQGVGWRAINVCMLGGSCVDPLLPRLTLTGSLTLDLDVLTPPFHT